MRWFSSFLTELESLWAYARAELRAKMINSKDNPLEWSQLMSELEDAHEHLGNLIKEMQKEAGLMSNLMLLILRMYTHI